MLVTGLITYCRHSITGYRVHLVDDRGNKYQISGCSKISVGADVSISVIEIQQAYRFATAVEMIDYIRGKAVKGLMRRHNDHRFIVILPDVYFAQKEPNTEIISHD